MIIWVASYPKSGNTLVRSIISALFFSKNGKFQLDQLKHTGQFERRDRLNLIKKINEEEFFNLDQLKILSKYWLTLQNKENMKIEKGFGFIKSHSSYVSMFNNYDFGFLGDIHMLQYLDEEKRIAYPGSTIQQNYGESIKKGFLLWEINNRNDFSSKFIPISNPHPFVTVDWKDSVENTIQFCERTGISPR